MRPFRLFFRLTGMALICCVLTACGVAKEARQPAADQLEALCEYVYPLRTAVPDGGDDGDLEELKTLLADARIVGLGEATHGTREIFQMKDRLVRYLAQNMDFDTFSIEAAMPEAYEVYRYTVDGEGTAAEWIKGMYFWTWSTEEVREMVEWMRRRERRDLLAEVARLRESMNLPAFPDSTRAWLIQNTRILEQYIDLCRIWTRSIARQGGVVRARDRFMAENLAWIQAQHPDTKIAVWAHNGHIRDFPGRMGGHLKRRFGDEYLTVGFALGEGTYTAYSADRRLASDHVPPGSYEYIFSLLGEEIFLLDLSRIKAERPDELRWFDRYLPGGSNIGSGAVENRFLLTQLTRDFDYLIFIRNSNASRLLP